MAPAGHRLIQILNICKIYINQVLSGAVAGVVPGVVGPGWSQVYTNFGNVQNLYKPVGHSGDEKTIHRLI